MSDVKEPFVYFLGVEVPYDVIFVVVHHSVKILPNDVFWGCSQLKDVTLPEGLEEIGEGAFATCESLKCINCPSAVIKIGMYAFAMCTSLTNVTLAGGVVTIERDTFSDCPSLEGITIPPKAFVIEVEVDSDGDSDNVYDNDSEDDGHVFVCQLVLIENGTIPLTDAKQVIVSPEQLNYISSCDLLEIENAITTIMNDQGRTREENIEQVLALIKSRALFEVSTILELALWKNKMDETDDSNSGSRGECRVMCGADEIIPCVLSYV
mmetsp:Transcript_17728/g.32040  ORF Transcript_17728/g.32040 Transcript_17728/m.32040 type:complete len:266 (-) Transcript_17728:82-879(-)